MAARKQTYVMQHSSVYLKVAGHKRLQQIEVGTHLELDPQRAKNMLDKGWVISLKDAKKIAIGGASEDTDTKDTE